MQLEGLAILCEVDETGSISAAARSLGLSRTTAWRRLNDLENQLDCRLVERTKRNLRLTSAGREAAVRGRALLNQAEALRDAAQARHRGDHGVLRVAGPPGAAELVLEALAFARSQWPGLRAVLYESPEPRDPVRDDFDLVTTYTRPKDPDLYIRKLITMEWCLHASPDYLKEHGHPDRVEELAGHPLVLHYLPTDRTDRLPLVEAGEVPIEPMLTTTNPAVALSAAERGLGLGFFPWQLAGVRSPLVRVLEGTVGSSRDLYLVAGLRQRESPRVQLGQQIMDWMQSVWVDLPESSNR